MVSPYFERAFEVTEDEVCIITKERVIVKVNETIQKKHGRPGGFFRGKKCNLDLEHRDTVCEGCPLDLSMKTRKSESVELDGYILLTVTPLFNGGPEPIGFLHVKKDISRLKVAEQKYKALLAGSLAGVTIIMDGKIVEANEGACNIFEYPLDELMGLSAKELTHPDDVMIAEDHINNNLSGAYEVRILTKGNKVKHIAIQAKPLELADKVMRITSFLDITELRNNN